MVRLLGYLAAGTTKTSGTAFNAFGGGALTVTRNQKITISISTNTAGTLQITKDGTNYYNGATFAANDAADLTLWVMAGDTLNFKQTSGSTWTLGWFEVFAEEGQ